MNSSELEGAVAHAPRVRLGDLLRYEQPTPYLVSSTNYSDDFSVPVLTAGKTFLLGYTDDTNGIYEASKATPVILFDDFTTASKWVDFPFKVKSSAAKILTLLEPGVASLRYVYYAMQVIRFTPTNHARHWIRFYSNLEIPVPPIEVQNEIVQILDSFTSLAAELEAELEARRDQYAFYRDQLLTFDPSVERIPLGEAGDVFGGLSGKNKADFVAGNSRYVTYANVYNHIAVDTEPDAWVMIKPSEHQRQLKYGDTLFTGSSETPQDVAMSSVVTREPSSPLYLNSFTIGYRPHNAELLNPEFSKFLFRSSPMRKQLLRIAFGVTRFNVSKSLLQKVLIPVPSRAEQDRIVSILDKFEAYTTSLTEGLPAEIEARRQQYEYYRDRLLSFPEARA